MRKDNQMEFIVGMLVGSYIASIYIINRYHHTYLSLRYRNKVSGIATLKDGTKVRVYVLSQESDIHVEVAYWNPSIDKLSYQIIPITTIELKGQSNEI